MQKMGCTSCAERKKKLQEQQAAAKPFQRKTQTQTKTRTTSNVVANNKRFFNI